MRVKKSPTTVKRGKQTKKKRPVIASGKSSSIVFGKVYSEGCPACVHLKPLWGDEANPALKNGKTIIQYGDKNGYTRIDVESSNMERDLPKINSMLKNGEKIKVSYFPTIYKVVQGRISYFDGDRTYEKITGFLKR